MKIVQVAETPLERAAIPIAEAFNPDNPAEAQRMLREAADKLRLTHGEIGALANVVTCMVHGQPWKKGGPIA